jgi:hypothetical protein
MKDSLGMISVNRVELVQICLYFGPLNMTILLNLRTEDRSFLVSCCCQLRIHTIIARGFKVGQG